MSLFLSVAIYLILWWLAFFTVLPIGAQSGHEAGEEIVAGSEPGAPKVHGLRMKIMLATGISAVVWLGVAWAVSVDLMGLRPH